MATTPSEPTPPRPGSLWARLFGAEQNASAEKPATKERMGRNPQTGQEIKIAAKPKRTVCKAYPLKALKEMVK